MRNDEKRTVEITLEKAREWYRKGGELQEVALQAFDEETLLDNRPRTWEEYLRANTWFAGVGISWKDNGVASPGLQQRGDAIVPAGYGTPIVAFMRLLCLRKEWVGNWEPDFKNEGQAKYCIYKFGGKIHVDRTHLFSHPLSFPNGRLAEDFASTFNALIMQAGTLI